MKFLFVDWWTYTYQDMVSSFDSMELAYDVLQYRFEDKNSDDKFVTMFNEQISSTTYDFVYSTNYFPVIAECCYKKNIIYVSWSYDNPLNVLNIEDTLGFPTNRVFFFDRLQSNKYGSEGFSNIFHLPLAVNVQRLDGIVLNSSDHHKYDSDVAFVGKLYPALLNDYLIGMTDYQKGFFQSICDIQQELHGYYIVDELIDDQLVNEINENYAKLRGDRNVVLSKEILSYGVACQSTRNERLVLLGLLSKRYHVNIFSDEKNSMLDNAHQYGRVDYYTEMPKAFKGGKVNLNINLKISQSGIPLRVMDILGCRGFLISSYQPEVAEYFENDKDIVLYECVEEAYEKTAWYLGHDELREEIALSGYEKVKKLFSYEKQITEMFTLSGVM